MIKNYSLPIGLYKGRPSYKRSLQLSKKNIRNFKTWNLSILFYFWGSFLPSWIRIHWPDWIRIQFGSGYGSVTLLFCPGGSRGDPEAAAGEHGGGERGGHAGQPGGRHPPHARRGCRSLRLCQVSLIPRVDQCCGSMTFWCGSGIRILLFSSLTFKMPKKKKKNSAYYFLKVPTPLHLHNFSKIKSQKESQYNSNQGFSYYFCMMIEGSESKRPKNMWIRWIQIRIRIRISNTGGDLLVKKSVTAIVTPDGLAWKWHQWIEHKLFPEHIFSCRPYFLKFFAKRYLSHKAVTYKLLSVIRRFFGFSDCVIPGTDWTADSASHSP